MFRLINATNLASVYVFSVVNDPGGGGLDWLVQAASQHPNSTTASPDELLAASLLGSPIPAPSATSGSGGGLAWLTAATSSSHRVQAGKKKPNVAQKPIRRTSGSGAFGGWITSVKLGVSTGNHSDEDGGGGMGTSGSAAGKPKSGSKRSASAASGPGGWLSAGALGVPVNSDSDEEGNTRGTNSRDRPLMMSFETQTDDDIEGIVKRGEVPKVLPWAKRWTPPPEPVLEPEPTVESSSAGDAESGQQVKNLGVNVLHICSKLYSHVTILRRSLICCFTRRLYPQDFLFSS